MSGSRSSDAGGVDSVAPDLEISERVDHLLEVMKGKKRALICTHDNPDPDSIASAYALGRLLEQKRKIPFTLTYGGVLGRAENREMVKLLKIPLVPIHRIDFDEFDVVGLVDTQPEVGNHGLTAERVEGKHMICVDHHPARLLSKEAAYADVGGDYGATSTVLTAYLHAANVVLDRNLATALFYGIKSDTRDLGREVSGIDVWAYSYLVAFTDMPMVSAMEHPRLPRDYFAVLMRAIQKAEVHGSVVSCDLGEIYIPDLVAEIADKLSRADGMRWSVVVGEYDGEVYASLRCNDRRYSAGKLVREVIAHYPNGSAGGHGSMAGARLPLEDKAKSATGRTRVRRAFLRAMILACGVEPNVRPERFADIQSPQPSKPRAPIVTPKRGSSSASGEGAAVGKRSTKSKAKNKTDGNGKRSSLQSAAKTKVVLAAGGDKGDAKKSNKDTKDKAKRGSKSASVAKGPRRPKR